MHSNVGADAYAQFWFRTWDWAYATGDPTLMKEYYAPSCSDCTLAAQEFSRIKSQGLHIVGGRIFFRRSQLLPGDHRYGATLADDITIEQKSLHTENDAGEVIQRAPLVRSITFRLWLRWTGDGWTIVQKGHVT